MDSKVTRIRSTYEYKSWLSKGVEAGGGIIGVFTGSASYSSDEYNEFTSEDYHYCYFVGAECITYIINFRDVFSAVSHPNLTAEFKSAATQLNATFDIKNPKPYFDFIEQFGTSAITGFIAGGRMSINIIVDSLKEMQHQTIDSSFEAEMSFFSLAGVGGHDSDKSESHRTFSNYSKQTSLQCIGGEPSNCTYSAWAPTVRTNPVPIDYVTVPITDLFSPIYFTVDVCNKKAQLEAAIIHYLRTNGTLAQMYSADASNLTNISAHVSSMDHGLNNIPTVTGVQFASGVIDRINGVFFSASWTNGDSVNPFGTSANQLAASVAISNTSKLFQSYDGPRGISTSYTQGYWAISPVGLKPEVGGNWLQVFASTGAANFTQVLADNVDCSNISMVEVQVAETPQPTTAYSLKHRSFGSPETWESAPHNPVSITCENRQLALQFGIQSQSVFSIYDVASNQYQPAFTAYFRANIFSRVADFDSGWTHSPPSDDRLLSLPHNLATAPELVHVFFSPDPQATRVYPVVWKHNSTNAPNPASIVIDAHTISLHFFPGQALFQVFNARANAWEAFKDGFWRITAFEAAVLLDLDL